MDKYRITKKITNGNFYLIAFIVGFLLFYLLREIVLAVLIGYNEVMTPGFLTDFQKIFQNGDYQEFSNPMWGVLNLSQFIGNLIFGVILLIFLGKSLIRDIKLFRKDIGQNIGGIIFGFILIMVGQNLLSKIYTYFGVGGTSANQESILLALDSSTAIFMYLSVVILAPLVEELLFRKLLYGVIEEKFKWPKIISVLVSAIIFASLHAVDIFFFQYFFMALILCGSYSIFKNNIIIPMGIHFLNNAMILAYIFMYIFR